MLWLRFKRHYSNWMVIFHLPCKETAIGVLARRSLTCLFICYFRRKAYILCRHYAVVRTKGN